MIRLRIADFGLRIEKDYIRYWVLGTGYWVLGIGRWVLGIGYWKIERVFGIRQKRRV